MRLETSFKVRLDLLAKNFEHLKGLTPDNEIIFMVKADAYGHGLLPIVEFATVELGIKNFGCASVGEAIAIRRNLPHLECNLWVFSDLNLELKAAKEAYLNLNILPVIAHKMQLEMFLEDKDFDSSPLVLKLDTGMNRLGVHEQELNEIISLLKKHNRRQIFHLMTHFANSYLKLRDGDKTHKQYQLFLKLKQQLQTAGINIEQTSCANSGAIEQGFSLAESHVRPGLMMYAGKTLPFSSWPGQTISSFSTNILKINKINKGVPVGYGSHVCGKNGHLVYLPVGYGDGILTYYSGRDFDFRGVKTQILGRVNMDMVAVFFEKLPAGFCESDRFVFWDESENSVRNLADSFRTTIYQVFTAITPRVSRRYLK